MKLFIVAFNPDEMIREVVRSVSYSNRDKKSSKNVEIIQSIDLPQYVTFRDFCTSQVACEPTANPSQISYIW